MSYIKNFDEIKKTRDLQGWIKNNSNVVCEYMITSDEEFFKSIGEKETKRYFKTAYEFVKNYRNLGEENIISAVVHIDEKSPHMHLVYIPVIHSFDKKSGKSIDKICCSEFWKGKDSYKILQDNFYKYMTRSNFNLERGTTENNQHIHIEKLKQITNYEIQEMFKETKELENEIISDDVEVIQENDILKQYIDKTKLWTSLVTDINKDSIERMLDDFYHRS